MPPGRTGFIEYMPQGQRTLTEVDGVVEIGRSGGSSDGLGLSKPVVVGD